MLAPLKCGLKKQVDVFGQLLSVTVLKSKNLVFRERILGIKMGNSKKYSET